MDDQALLEGIVVFSDEDGPGGQKGDAPVRQLSLALSLTLSHSLHETNPEPWV